MVAACLIRACKLRAMHAGGLLHILAEAASATRAGWHELMSDVRAWGVWRLQNHKQPRR